MSDLAEEINTVLVASGANPFRAKMVSRFVAQCYELLLQAHCDLTRASRWHKFCQKRGATTTKRTDTDTPTRNIAETAISGDLSLEANRLLASPPDTSSPYVLKTAISSTQADATMPSDAATGNSSKRPDLIFLPAALETRLTFALEAKIIRKAVHITNELLGETGFGCFTRGDDPYESNGVIGLLGYVERGAVEAMTEQALADIEKHDSFLASDATNFELAYTNIKHRTRLVISKLAEGNSLVCVTGMLGLDLVTAWPLMAD